MEKGNRSPLLWLSNITKTSEMFQSTGYGFKVNLSNTIGFIESEFGIHITGTNFLIIAVLLINSPFGANQEEYASVEVHSVAGSYHNLSAWI